VLVGLYGLFADPQSVHRPIEMLEGLIPSNAAVFLADQMRDIAESSRIHLGAGTGGAFIAAVWSAWSGASGLIAALNVAYGENESRGFAKRAWHSLVLAVLSAIFLLIVFVFMSVLPLVLDRSDLNLTVKAVVLNSKWPTLMILCILGLAILYRFAPSRRHAKWRWVSPGAVLGTLVWIFAATGFSFYVSHFPTYNNALGVLGSITLLLTWSYLTAFAILLGAELNAELERNTSKDTTEGPEKVAGKRGAVVADRLPPSTSRP
jgi:membrane protein